MTLDTPESGEWEELSVAHRDLLPAPKTPSGYTSAKYGKMAYAFPAAAQLRTMTEMSSCLVGRQKWASPIVASDLDVLFGPDSDKAQSMIRSWRTVACERFCIAFGEMKKMEKRAFGDNSFFYRKEAGLPLKMADTTEEIAVEDSDDDGSMIGDEELLELRA
jgi:hypothetical protein